MKVARRVPISDNPTAWGKNGEVDEPTSLDRIIKTAGFGYCKDWEVKDEGEDEAHKLSLLLHHVPLI